MSFIQLIKQNIMKSNNFKLSAFEEELLFENSKPQKEIKQLLPFLTKKIPSLRDDFYSKIISSYKNIVIFGAHENLYSLNIVTERVHTLKHFCSYITSVQIINSEEVLVGFISGKFVILNLVKKKINRSIRHGARISSIVKYDYNNVFTASSDKNVRKIDLREKNYQIINTHLLEVTGIAHKNNLLATGGNDNLVKILDLRTNKNLFSYSHKAAIRALSFSHNKLFSGGGLLDKQIQIWNCTNKKLQSQVSFHSQICNIHTTRDFEIICTFGYSNNDIKVFNWNMNLKKASEYQECRVVHFDQNESSGFFITGSQRYMKFWYI